MRSSKFAPLSAPVYYPKPLTGRQYKSGQTASAFLASHGFSPIDGAPMVAKVRKPRVARVLKDTSHLTLDV